VTRSHAEHSRQQELNWALMAPEELPAHFQPSSTNSVASRQPALSNSPAAVQQAPALRRKLPRQRS
jgi:hypothetical protein